MLKHFLTDAPSPELELTRAGGLPTSRLPNGHAAFTDEATPSAELSRAAENVNVLTFVTLMQSLHNEAMFVNAS